MSPPPTPRHGVVQAAGTALLPRIEAYFQGHGDAPHRHDTSAIGGTMARYRAVATASSTGACPAAAHAGRAAPALRRAWHQHADTDEAFFVIQGRLRIYLPGGAMHLDAHETVVVPRARSDAGDLWF